MRAKRRRRQLSSVLGSVVVMLSVESRPGRLQCARQTIHEQPREALCCLHRHLNVHVHGASHLGGGKMHLCEKAARPRCKPDQIVLRGGKAVVSAVSEINKEEHLTYAVVEIDGSRIGTPRYALEQQNALGHL